MGFFAQGVKQDGWVGCTSCACSSACVTHAWCSISELFGMQRDTCTCTWKVSQLRCIFTLAHSYGVDS